MRRNLSDWLDAIERQHPKSIDMGLERVREVATRMGFGKPARQVITVGGTNGKGSTVAFIEAIARANGWRVGAYTSPHLLAYNERVRIDGRDATDAEMIEAFEAVEAARSDTTLTYFEFGTLAALWLFERADLDLVILEVGLGGRLDATNIIDPDVAVITTVDLDHQDWLGDDREAIGIEKAGIARAWKPLVLGEDDPPASVLRRAYAIGASAIRGGSDYLFEGIDAETWRWREPGFELMLPIPTLAGPIQLRNAATAIAALRALPEEIDLAAYVTGMREARITGRMQRIDHGGMQVMVDVGHNPQAAGQVADALRVAPVDGRTVAVYAALADKDHAGVVQALAPVVDGWRLAGSLAAGARGMAVETLSGRLATSAITVEGRHADVEAALAATLAGLGHGDRLLVFGSFHAAEQALRVLNGMPST